MDSPHNFGCDCSCHCNTRELPSFSNPFLQFGCPMDPNAANPFTPGVHIAEQDNELLLKDPQLRRQAMVNTLDCQVFEAHSKRETSKGPDYGRASGSYYRARHHGDVQTRHCGRLDGSYPTFPPVQIPKGGEA